VRLLQAELQGIFTLRNIQSTTLRHFSGIALLDFFVSLEGNNDMEVSGTCSSGTGTMLTSCSI
jgi:hypothetical protein